MKTLVNILCLLMAAGWASAQTDSGHEWKATLKVVDDSGQPVAGAEVWVNYLTNRFIGLTDTNGTFTASHTDHSAQLAFQAQKAGYYSCGMQYFLGFHYDPVKWSPTVKIVLDRIINPIPMYARSIEKGPPAFNEPVGYDMILGDWVAPHGNGKNSDIIFNGELDKKSSKDFDYKLTVSFPNHGDGIQGFSSNEGGLRSPYQAPASGYQPHIVRTMSRHPDEGTKEDLDLSRNYFFRVRTILDENGNVKSALYGKIYGDFMQFTYYLNPTPNNRNIEFDLKQNLIKNMKSSEQVQMP